MGQITQARMAAWQQQAGLEPARGGRLEVLRALQREAFELIKIMELEISGIRDGDGGWHGSDVLQGALNEIARLDAALNESDYGHLKNVPVFPPENDSAEIPF